MLLFSLQVLQSDQVSLDLGVDLRLAQSWVDPLVLLSLEGVHSHPVLLSDNIDPLEEVNGQVLRPLLWGKDSEIIVPVNSVILLGQTLLNNCFPILCDLIGDCSKPFET